jgi:hypothetical protein
MKKKLAVLIGGMYREFDNAHKSWNFLNNNETDVFFSTWDETYEKNSTLNINVIEKVTKERILKHLPNAIINIETDNPYISLNGNKMVSHWRRLFNMINTTDYEYEKIILIRPDIFFNKENTLNEFINSIDTDYLYALGPICFSPPPGLLFIQDMLFLGKFDTVKNAILTFPMCDLTYKDIHYHLARHFVLNDIYVEKIPNEVLKYSIMRNSHRNNLDKSFEELHTISEEWWNYNKGL